MKHLFRFKLKVHIFNALGSILEAGNILCSGVSDEMLEQRILKVGASQISVKVKSAFLVVYSLKVIRSFS